MSSQAERSEALSWVLAKLSARALKAPVYKPPESPLLKPTAPTPGLKPSKPTLSEDQKRERRGREFGLWQQYSEAKSNSDKNKHFQVLIKSLRPVIDRRVSQFSGIEVNKAAQRAAAIEMARDALDSYDPSKGAAVATWVSWNLRPIKRFNVGLQNAAVRITEGTSQLITPYRTAVTELTQKLGYEPTTKQIVDHTHSRKWGGPALSEKDILALTAVKKSYDLNAGGEEVEGAGLHYNDPYVQAAHIVYHRLKPHEQKMHELMFPRDGSKGELKSGALAKKLGWHVSKVSKAKRVMQDLIQEHMGE